MIWQTPVCLILTVISPFSIMCCFLLENWSFNCTLVQFDSNSVIYLKLQFEQPEVNSGCYPGKM